MLLQLSIFIVRSSPDFFDNVEISNGSDESKEYAAINLNQKLLVKIVEWDTIAKVLSPGELQYVADFAYGLKKLNSFHENNIRRHLNRLVEAGFS